VSIVRSASSSWALRDSASSAEAGFEPNPISEYDDPITLALAVGNGEGVGLSGGGMSSRYSGIDYLLTDPLWPIAEISAVWRAGQANPLVQHSWARWHRRTHSARPPAWRPRDAVR
jgi:hypothetical protein